ncbi:MAG: sugar phosphate isomerase/epimerase family protein [Cetobacterium sp.]
MINNLHISDLIFYNDNVDEIIKFLKENNIENLELFIEPLDEEYTKKMQEVLNRYKFKSISFHGPFRRCRLTDMTENGWEDILYSYIESFKIAQRYKASFVVLHSNEKLVKPVEKDLVKKRIKKLVELGKEYEVDIVVENVGIGENMLFNQQEYEELILDNDYRCLIDIGHAYLNKWNIQSLIEKLQNNIRGYHFHNNNGILDEHKPICSGKINYDEIIYLYKKYTPNSKIVLEYDFTESKDKLLADIKYLSNKLKEV